MPKSNELGPVVSEVSRLLRGRLKSFGIARCDKGLVLVGWAPSFYVKQLAQQAVKRLTPVPIAENEIEVA